MTDLRELLTDLAPLVWVAGSWARGTNYWGSDLDLAPRINPRYDPGAERGTPGHRETLMPEVIAVLDKHGVAWESDGPGSIYMRVMGELIEVYEPFVTALSREDWDEVEVTTHPVEVYGAMMEAADEEWLACTPWPVSSPEKQAKWKT